MCASRCSAWSPRRCTSPRRTRRVRAALGIVAHARSWATERRIARRPAAQTRAPRGHVDLLSSPYWHRDCALQARAGRYGRAATGRPLRAGRYGQITRFGHEDVTVDKLAAVTRRLDMDPAAAVLRILPLPRGGTC